MSRQSAAIVSFLLATLVLIAQAPVQAAEWHGAEAWRPQLLASGLSPTTVASLQVVDVTAGPTEGTLTWRLRQQVGDLEVYDSDIELVTGASGRVLYVSDVPMDMTRDGALSSLIGDRQVIEFVLKFLFGESSARVRSAGAEGNTTFWVARDFALSLAVTRVALPGGPGVFQEGFVVETSRGADGYPHETVVDGTGSVVSDTVLE